MEIVRAFREVARLLVKYFEEGAETERMFRREIVTLLPPDIHIYRASKYTESDEEFKGVKRLRKPPTDYIVTHGGMVIAAIEVTTGSKGYSYAMSNCILVDEDKLARMDQFNEGFVVERVLVGEPHFIWAERNAIRNFKLQVGTYWTDIKIWKTNLKSLVETLIKLTEREEHAS